MKLLFLETQPIRPKVDVETHNSRKTHNIIHRKIDINAKYKIIF